MQSSNFLPKALNDVIHEFSKLPSIGHRSAQRLAFHLLKKNKTVSLELAESLKQLHENIAYCPECFNFCSDDKCKICTNPKRERSQVCVVEDVLDLIAIENSQNYHGLYHVLHGVLSPLKGVGIENIKINELANRIQNYPEIKEVIIATNTTTEGETTALYIKEILKEFDVQVSRIASGMPFGGDLDYADSLTLSKALENRSSI